MDNQHRLMTGYKDQKQHDIDLFNKLVELGKQIEEHCTEVSSYVHLKATAQDTEAKNKGEVQLQRRTRSPLRFVAMAESDFQVALMLLKRAVMQPDSF